MSTTTRIYYLHVLAGMATGEPHGYITRLEGGIRRTCPVIAVTTPGNHGIPMRGTSPADAVARWVAVVAASEGRCGT